MTDDDTTALRLDAIECRLSWLRLAVTMPVPSWAGRLSGTLSEVVSGTVDDVTWLLSLVRKLREELDDERAEHTALARVRARGCDCSDDDACKFARE